MSKNMPVLERRQECGAVWGKICGPPKPSAHKHLYRAKQICEVKTFVNNIKLELHITNL